MCYKNVNPPCIQSTGNQTGIKNTCTHTWQANGAQMRKVVGPFYVHFDVQRLNKATLKCMDMPHKC